MTATSFELHKLGWKAFEDLVDCIFREVMGQTYQSFATGPDGGRDGAFYGQWKPQRGESISGHFTIQCKHTSRSANTLPKSVIAGEIPKIRRLAENGLADSYIFVTNRHLSAERESIARNTFANAGAAHSFVYGSTWINSQISANPRLRRLVPRLYGLGDLTQIITHQSYRQAQEVLAFLTPDLECFVPTLSYRNCAHALRECGVVLLLGEPASGKTMIANLLALSAADEWQLQTLILSSPDDLNRLWDPDDPGQFLWVDDAFGTTQFDPIRAREWNQRLPMLKTAIASGARAVFTSRDYIFRAAQDHLKATAFDLFEDSKIVINVEKLTETERHMILYNHLKCGKQSRSFRSNVKPWLAEAAATPKFLPEIARRFADPKFTRNLVPNARGVSQFFEQPVEWLAGVIANLASAEKAALALIFIQGGRMPVPIPEEQEFIRTIATMDSSLGEVKTALTALNGSFIRREKEHERENWRFRHPTVRDAFASYVASNPELIDIYLAGVSVSRMMGEVICGDMNVQGARIIVPPERFSAVLAKLGEISTEESGMSDVVGSFLSRRCSSRFLERYFHEIKTLSLLPKTICVLNTWDASLSILSRLHKNDRLPEDVRQETMKRVRQIAMEEYSCEFVNEPAVLLLAPQEEEEILAELYEVIFSNSTEIVDEIADGWDGEEEPDDLFSGIVETLGYFENAGNDEQKLFASQLISDIGDTVSELGYHRSFSGEFEPLGAEETRATRKSVGISIFDDVDE